MKLILIIFGLIITINACAQGNFDPKVIVLMPLKVEIEDGLSEQIEFYEKYAIEYQKQYMTNNKDSLLELISKSDSIPLNDKELYKQKIESADKLNFQNKIFQDYAESFQNFLGTEFNLPLVLVDTAKSFHELNLMRNFADAVGADYLINTLSLNVTKFKKNDILIKPKFTVYYREEDRLIDIVPSDFNQYNKSYITFNKKTLNLFYDDMDARSKILREIESNGNKQSREVKHQKRILNEKRINILDSLFIIGKKNDFLKNTFTDSILDQPIDSLYTSVVSKNKDQFLAFFASINNWEIEGFKGSNEMICVIYGKKINSKWILNYEQPGVTNLLVVSREENARDVFMNLNKMNFFKEGSTIINSNFWKKELFKDSTVKFK